MHRAMLLLTVFAFVGSLWAADPIIGTWKANHAKSKLPQDPDLPAPPQVTVTYREISQDRIEMTYTVVEANGSSRTDVCTYPAQGGAVKCQREMDSGFQMLAGPGEWYGIYITDGKQVGTRHKVVAKDGKTIHETMKMLGDPNGKTIEDRPFEALWVYDRQPVQILKMNPAKSKASGTISALIASPLKSLTATLEDQGKSVRVVENLELIDGRTMRRSYVATYDGKEFPVEAPDIDACSFRLTDEKTTTYVCKKEGKELFKGNMVRSDDGKSAVDSSTGKDASGQDWTLSIFFDIQ